MPSDRRFMFCGLPFVLRDAILILEVGGQKGILPL